MRWTTLVLLVATLGVSTLAVVGCSSSDNGGTTTVSSPVSNTTPSFSASTRQPPPGSFSTDNRTAPSIDWSLVAAKLGVTEEELHEAMGSETQWPLDFVAIAKKLGVNEESLREAFGFPGQDSGQLGPGGPGGDSEPPPTPQPTPG
jgi:hypothetical protein